jgi:hypothetical protein
MVGIDLTFVQQVPNGTDALNNPVYTTTDVEVEDCLVAPVTVPTNAREEQAIAQSRDQIYIHFPKAFTGDLSASNVTYDGKTFKLDSDTVKFMDGNTPTRWNRYVRAERINV